MKMENKYKVTNYRNKNIKKLLEDFVNKLRKFRAQFVELY